MLNDSILRRLTRVDKRQFYCVSFCPSSQHQRDKFRTIVTALHDRDPVGYTNHPPSWQIQIDFRRQRLMVKVIKMSPNGVIRWVTSLRLQAGFKTFFDNVFQRTVSRLRSANICLIRRFSFSGSLIFYIRSFHAVISGMLHLLLLRFIAMIWCSVKQVLRMANSYVGRWLCRRYA